MKTQNSSSDMTETRLPYRSFVGSRPFNLLVGPQRERFYVHAELLASCSQYFATLVRGPMKEAEDRLAELNDIEVETFVRFVEYLYTEDYAVPEPDIMLSSSDIALGPADVPPEIENADEEAIPTSLQPTEADWDWGSRSHPARREKIKKYDKKRKKYVFVEEGCTTELYDENTGRRRHGLEFARSVLEEKACVLKKESWEPRPNNEVCEDYTQVLLCHARLYCFSDKHSVEGLRDLTLQKLRLTLTRFKLFKERVSDIVELLRYTYANTMEHDEGVDELRSLVMDYIVCNLEVMVEDPDFLELLTQADTLAKDLVLKSVKRLD